MKLTVASLDIKYFKAIKDLTIQLDRGGGAHLIVGRNRTSRRLGSNGAGKSSITDALCFVLFGRTVAGLRGTDVRPWKQTSKPTELTLNFSLGDKRHKVYRSLAPSRLMLDGKDIDQDSLERHLGFNFETFTHTVVLGQGRELFFDLTSTKKMEIFTEALNLDRWEERSARAKKEADKLDFYAEGTRNRAEAKLRQYEWTKDLYLKTRKLMEDWNQAAAARRTETEAQLKSWNKRLASVMKRHDDADLAYDSALTELRPLEKQDREAAAALQEANSEYNFAITRIETIQIEQERLSSELKKVKAGKCPTCGGPFSNQYHRMKLETKLKDLATETKKYSLPTLKKAVDTARTSLRALTTARDAFNVKANKARDVLDQTIPELEEAKAKIRQLSDQLAEQENPHSQQVMELRRAKTNDWDEYQDLLHELKIQERKAKRTRFWVKGFRDLQLHLIKEILQELELATNAMLEQIGLSAWSVSYATEKETKKGTIRRGLVVFVQSPDNKKPVRWECWSGGEGQRLRIAGALALSEVLLARAGVEPSLEILDEPSSHLSTEGVEDLCEFLVLRARQLHKNIFFVDQTVVESSLFDSITTVVRTPEKGTFITER